MFNLRFSIENPFCDRFESLGNWHGGTPFKHKFWEVQTMKSNDVVAFDFRVSTMRDHAGVDLWLGLLGYAVNLQFYDSRHWNNETGTWEIYPGDKELI